MLPVSTYTTSGIAKPPNLAPGRTTSDPNAVHLGAGFTPNASMKPAFGEQGRNVRRFNLPKLNNGCDSSDRSGHDADLLHPPLLLLAEISRREKIGRRIIFSSFIVINKISRRSRLTVDHTKIEVFNCELGQCLVAPVPDISPTCRGI